MINHKTLPQLLINQENPDEIIAVTFEDNGQKYYFSNTQGHKVMTTRNSSQRPMTKDEFNQIRRKMIGNTIQCNPNPNKTLEELAKLDFSLGHANCTFQIITSPLERSNLGTLVINLGNARYLYNQEKNTVFHIDHSKLINGTFIQDGPEKEKIINIISNSKTMTKKIASRIRN